MTTRGQNYLVLSKKTGHWPLFLHGRRNPHLVIVSNFLWTKKIASLLMWTNSEYITCWRNQKCPTAAANVIEGSRIHMERRVNSCTMSSSQWSIRLESNLLSNLSSKFCGNITYSEVFHVSFERRKMGLKKWRTDLTFIPQYVLWFKFILPTNT